MVVDMSTNLVVISVNAMVVLFMCLIFIGLFGFSHSLGKKNAALVFRCVSKFYSYIVTRLHLTKTCDLLSQDPSALPLQGGVLHH